MRPASLDAILAVERAISDLRRGEPVLLSGAGSQPLFLLSGEYAPDKDAVTDPAHPGVRLMKLAGLMPLAIIKMNADRQAGMLEVSAGQIAHYPEALATELTRVSEAQVPLKASRSARIIAFRPRLGHEEHLAVVIGEPARQPAPLVRIHSSCVTGDVFGSLRCDCGSQLQKSVEIIETAGGGAVLYLSQEGRGIGIASKLRAYALQDTGLDTVEANLALGFAPDERDFALAARMLKDLGLTRITLLTNNLEKVSALTSHGIEIAQRMPLVIPPNEHNTAYLSAKALKMGHQF